MTTLLEKALAVQPTEKRRRVLCEAPFEEQLELAAKLIRKEISVSQFVAVYGCTSGNATNTANQIIAKAFKLGLVVIQSNGGGK